MTYVVAAALVALTVWCSTVPGLWMLIPSLLLLAYLFAFQRRNKPGDTRPPHRATTLIPASFSLFLVSFFWPVGILFAIPGFVSSWILIKKRANGED